MFSFVYRTEDDHKRATALVQAIGGGDDVDDLLSDGIRSVRIAGVQRRVEEQVRTQNGR